jgi:membrane protein
VFPPLRLRSALTLGGLGPRELILRTWRAIEEHEIQTRAAAVSFYAMLAMVPFLGLVLTFAVQLLPDLTGHSPKALQLGNTTVVQLEAALEQTLPPEAVSEIKEQIARIQQNPPVGLISVGLAITLWLASTLFVAVIDAMNRIYGVQERRGFIKLRLIAIFMTVVEAAILVGSLLAIVGWRYILRHLQLGDSSAILATGVLYGVILIMVLLSFALCFYVAPDADQSWEWITPGSLAGSILFVGATLLFRIYVHNFANYDKTYGPLGGVMVLLFWFWISSLILLGAAQMNKVIEEASPLGKNYGQRINPAEAPDFDAMKPEPANP